MFSVSISLIPPQTMAKWFYYSVDGSKIGVSSPDELKQRAKLGMITPDTIIENEEGKQALAGKLKGLVFAEIVQPTDIENVAPPVIEETYGFAPLLPKPIPVPSVPSVEANPRSVRRHLDYKTGSRFVTKEDTPVDVRQVFKYGGGLLFTVLFAVLLGILFQTFPTIERIAFIIVVGAVAIVGIVGIAYFIIDSSPSTPKQPIPSVPVPPEGKDSESGNGGTHPVVVFAAMLFIVWMVSGQIGGCIDRQERDKQFRREWENQNEADRHFQELPHWAK